MENQLTAYAAEADAAMGRHAPADAYKAWCGELLQRQPHLKASAARFMKRAGVGGVPVRKRFDFKYSRVGVAWDIGGNFQTENPTSLFTVQIGGQDAVLGQLTQVDTNVVSAGKQDSAEMFKAFGLGFNMQVAFDNSGAVNIDQQAAALRALMENTQATLTLGTQNRQRFPTLEALPGLSVGFQTGGGAVAGVPTQVTSAATQGQQSIVRFTTPIYLGAGESYSVELSIKRSLQPAGLDLIPQGVLFGGLIIAIQCVMYGLSYTGIPG